MKRTFLLYCASLLMGVCYAHGAELFHNGGVGQCDGCHVRKGQGPGFQNVSTAAVKDQLMLIKSDPSSTCLMCHSGSQQAQAGQHVIATDRTAMLDGPPLQLTPGGDFGWLRKNYRWSKTADGTGELSEVSPGEHHGHNVVAMDYGYGPDIDNIVAPGGTYPAEGLHCTSCHDPHGTFRRDAKGDFVTNSPSIISSGSYSDSPSPDADFSVGSYRLLAGIGYQPKRLVGEYNFKEPPPVAVSPSLYNRSEYSTSTRVVYGKGMSEWCQNCHGKAHKGGGHPAGNTAKFTDQVIKTYNTYLGSGNLAGSASLAYNSLVPYEVGSSDYEVLKRLATGEGTVSMGQKERPNVMCLSCHRAHASGWDYIGRWNMRPPIIVYKGSYPGTDNKESPPEYAQGRTSQDVQKAYYDRPAKAFSSHQRGLCSKCHAKD